MSTMNVFVGNLQLPPFPAGQPASEVYKTLKDAYGGGILVGPNGVGILNNSNLIPAGNYTYVPAAAVVPRVGVAPYATTRVGPYAAFTYASAPGIAPHASGVTPHSSGVAPHSPGVASHGPPGVASHAPPGVATHALALATHAPGVAPHAPGVTPRATTRIAPPAATRVSPRANARVAPRTPESQVPPTAETPHVYPGVVQEQKAESTSPVAHPTCPAGGPSRTTVAARGKLPDWSPQELKKLILAKKQEWEHATCGTPLQKKMASGKEKWKIVAEYLVNEGMKNPVRDSSSCKKKWEKVTGEFKKVYDYERIVCSADESYYAMSASERRGKNLPSNFSEDVYDMIVDWLPSRHEVDPSALHVMDSSTRSLDDETPASVTTPVDAAREDPPIEYEDPDLQNTSQVHVGGPPDGQSYATPQVDRLKAKGKRKHLSSETGDSILHGSTVQQIVEVLKDDDMRKNILAEVQLAVRRDTMDWREACVAAHEERTEARHTANLAVQREVGLANAASSMANVESVKSVADALLQMVAAHCDLKIHNICFQWCSMVFRMDLCVI